jgi:hypothetical protein
MKVKVRTKLRNKWKQEFEKRGLTFCECQFAGCWKVVHGFAHAKKSRNLLREEYNKVVAACNPCHRIMDEDMDEESMEAMIDLIIASSEWPNRTEYLNESTRKWEY